MAVEYQHEQEEVHLLNELADDGLWPLRVGKMHMRSHPNANELQSCGKIAKEVTLAGIF